MGIFDRAVARIFSIRDLTDTCTINGKEVICIASAVKDQSALYLDQGKQGSVNFTLDIITPASNPPKINDRVLYKGISYKISQVELDSAGSTLKLYLIELSRGIR